MDSSYSAAVWKSYSQLETAPRHWVLSSAAVLRTSIFRPYLPIDGKTLNTA